MRNWSCIYANDVFVGFARDRGADRADRRHTQVLFNYVQSRALKRRRDTVYFLHLPKTAGTSVWATLSAQVPSSIYYDKPESFLHNPPCRGEYDLVGGHVPWGHMRIAITADDRIAAVMRDPMDRFRSAFLHSRRADADVETFSPPMRAMRTGCLRDFILSPHGQIETRLQLLTLGFGYDTEYTPDRDKTIFSQAVAMTRDRRNMIGTTATLRSWMGAMFTTLGIADAAPVLPMLNQAGPPNADDRALFDAERDLIETENTMERRLFDTVCREDKHA